MLNQLIKFWTSLRLTVVCLSFGIVLVFVGTVAQANEGLYQAQERYFKDWFVWGITMFGYKIPIGLPGGYLIGTVLLINLVAAHIKRFQLSWKKLGIHITHAGIILLLLGQLATDLLSRETQMRFSEGQAKTYSESSLDYELAFFWDVDAKNQQVVVIPQSLLHQGEELAHPQLPFKVKVLDSWSNSEPSFRAPMAKNSAPQATQGIANAFDFRQTPLTHKMNDKNVPTARIELSGPEGSQGTWMVSGWAGDEVMADALYRSWVKQLGPKLAQQMAGQLLTTQTANCAGRTVTMSLRPVRAYHPFAVTLLETKHEIYPGTDIPRNFQSRVRIENDRTGENREVDIYMNNPLRYAGMTFYQYQMGAAELQSAERSSTLQVVLNPSWLAPYFGCLLVGGGLVVQFMIHLIAFIRRRIA